MLNKYNIVGTGSEFTYLRLNPAYSVIELEIARSFDTDPDPKRLVVQVFEYPVGSIAYYIRMSAHYIRRNRVESDLYPNQSKWGIHWYNSHERHHRFGRVLLLSRIHLPPCRARGEMAIEDVDSVVFTPNIQFLIIGRKRG